MSLGCVFSAACEDQTVPSLRDDLELGIPAEGYLSPDPAGCDRSTREDEAVLSMPWQRRAEIFIPPASAVMALAVDYDVTPTPAITWMRLSSTYDQVSQSEMSQVAVDCPSTIPLADLLPSGVLDDVVRVRVQLGASIEHSRMADVMMSVGAATWTLETTEFVAGNDASSRWYVLFEPASGSVRAALLPLPSGSPGTLAIPGLPSGPARIALVQSPSVLEQEPFGVLEAPLGFAASFPEHTKGWYEAIATRGPGEPIHVREIVPVDVTPALGELGGPSEWADSNVPLVLGAPEGDETHALEVPCGAPIDVYVSGLALVTITAGATAHEIGPGQSVSVDATCEGGAVTTSWTIRTRAMNGRPFDLVLRKAVSP